METEAEVAVQPETPEVVAENVEAKDEQKTEGTEQVQAAPEKKDREKDRLAFLARKERQIQQEKERIKAQKAEFDRIQKEAEEAKQQLASVRQQLRANPKKFLEENGLTYDQLVDFIANGEQPTPDMQVQSVKEELENFKRQQKEEAEAQVKAQREYLQRQQEALVQNFYEEASSVIQSDPDQYEFLNLEGDAALELVSQVVIQFNEKTGKVLSPEEAAKYAEEYLEKRFEEQQQKLAATKKWKSKFGPKEDLKDQGKGEDAPKQTPSAQRRTIDNGLTARTVPQTSDDVDLGDDWETGRIERLKRLGLL